MFPKPEQVSGGLQLAAVGKQNGCLFIGESPPGFDGRKIRVCIVTNKTGQGNRHRKRFRLDELVHPGQGSGRTVAHVFHAGGWSARAGPPIGVIIAVTLRLEFLQRRTVPVRFRRPGWVIVVAYRVYDNVGDNYTAVRTRVRFVRLQQLEAFSAILKGSQERPQYRHIVRDRVMRTKIRRVGIGDDQQPARVDGCARWKLEVNSSHAPGVPGVLRIIQRNRMFRDVLELHEFRPGVFFRMIMNLGDDDRSHFGAGVGEAQCRSRLGRILGLAAGRHEPAESHAVFRSPKGKPIGKPGELAAGLSGKQKNLITMGIEGKPSVIGVELFLGENDVASRRKDCALGYGIFRRLTPVIGEQPMAEIHGSGVGIVNFNGVHGGGIAVGQHLGDPCRLDVRGQIVAPR